MIKKILIAIILFVPLCVLAEEEKFLTKDNFYIEEANYVVKFLDKNKIRIEENFSTALIYGSTSQTYFFNRPIDKVYSYNFRDTKKENKLKHEYIYAESDSQFVINDNDNYIEYKFGKEFSVLKELENFKIMYDITFENKKDSIYSYILGNVPYEVKKVNFELSSPFDLEGKELYFSLDGKTFNKELEGLTYIVEYGYYIKGEYDKGLDKNESIYFLMYDPLEEVIVEDSKDNTNMYLIVGGLVILFGLSAYIIINKAKK